MTHTILHADLLAYLRGNRWLVLQADSGTHLLINPFGALANVAFPEAQNLVATLREVGILRPINAHPFVLTFGKNSKPVGVGVPVIAIELNNDSMVGNEGVNTELAADHDLRLEVNAGALKYRVTRALKTVDAAGLLIGIHPAQHGRAIRVVVTTFKGTVGRISSRTGRRPTKQLATRLACVLVFVACLPCDLVIDAAKVVIGVIEAHAGKVNLLPAPLTRNIAPISPLGNASDFSAFTTAIALLTTNRLSARRARMIAGAKANVHARLAAIVPCVLGNARRTDTRLELVTADSTGTNRGALSRGAGALATAILRFGRKACGYRLTAMLACDGTNTISHVNTRSILSTLFIIQHRLHKCYCQPRRLLVPFAGSGSEMIGALLAGWDVVTGIEREAEYVELARARVGWWAQFATYDEARKAYEQVKREPIILPAPVGIADDKPAQLALFEEVAS